MRLSFATGAALRATDDWGDTLLHRAATAPYSSAAIAQLVALGADMDAPGHGGLRPRLMAAAAGQADNAACLARFGASTEVGPMTEVDWCLYLAAVAGLPGPVRVNNIDYPLEGTLAEGVFGPMAEAFAHFCTLAPQVPPDTAGRIADALRSAPLQLLRKADQIVADAAAGAAIILPSGWTGHATTHVFDGDLAVMCNRPATHPLLDLLPAAMRPTLLPLRAANVHGARAALMGAALLLRNQPNRVAKPRLAYLNLRHRPAMTHPLRRALRPLPCKPLRGHRCAVANAKAGVLALLLLEAHRRDPAHGLEQAPQWHACFKLFTTVLRYHALRAYVARHLPGDPSVPPNLELVERARDRLLSSGRLSALPQLARDLEDDRVALEATWQRL